MYLDLWSKLKLLGYNHYDSYPEAYSPTHREVTFLLSDQTVQPYMPHSDGSNNRNRNRS